MKLPTRIARPARRRSLLLVLIAIVLTVALSGQAPQITIPSDIRTLLPAEAESALETVTETITDAQPGLTPVAETIDGDTIRVDLPTGRATVRLLGIDTPETHDPRRPVQCFGEAAAGYTRQLLTKQSVRLEPDPTNSDKDKYGRLLRYVYLPDGTLVNAKLIADGYAFAYTVFPLTKLDEFRALEVEAREANRGLWGGCTIDESTKVKQTTGAK
jgi:micrococcal nuclease